MSPQTGSGAIVTLSSDPAFAIDAQLRVVAMNDRAAAILGYRAGDAVGQRCWEVLRAVSANGRPLCSPRCPAARSFYLGHPFGEVQVLREAPDGTRVPLGLSSLIVPPELSTDGTLAVVFLHPTSPLVHLPAGAVLRVYTLGSFRIYQDQQEVISSQWRRKQSLTLLKYLITRRGKPVHREEVVELLWPDVRPEIGLNRLKVTVSFLRHELGRAQGDGRAVYVLSDGGYYGIAQDHTWVDVDAFDELVNEGRRRLRAGNETAAREAFEAAVALYGGPYLPSDLYADWCAPERERLGERYLLALTELAGILRGQGHREEAIASYRRALDADPCRESIARDLMRTLWEAGRREEALHQYRLMRRVLQEDLGIPPLPETTALYEGILHDRPLPRPHPL